MRDRGWEKDEKPDGGMEGETDVGDGRRDEAVKDMH